jgi:hypothetical protein
MDKPRIRRQKDHKNEKKRETPGSADKPKRRRDEGDGNYWHSGNLGFFKFLPSPVTKKYLKCILVVPNPYSYIPKLKIAIFALRYIWDTFVPVPVMGTLPKFPYWCIPGAESHIRHILS